MVNELVLYVTDLSTLLPGVNVTVRKLSDKYRRIQQGQRCVLRDEEVDDVVGVIQHIRKCRFFNIDKEWLLKEHDACDRTKWGLYKSMISFYPGFTPLSFVAVIWFTCEEVVDV